MLAADPLEGRQTIHLHLHPTTTGYPFPSSSFIIKPTPVCVTPSPVSIAHTPSFSVARPPRDIAIASPVVQPTPARIVHHG